MTEPISHYYQLSVIIIVLVLTACNTSNSIPAKSDSKIDSIIAQAVTDTVALNHITASIESQSKLTLNRPKKKGAKPSPPAFKNSIIQLDWKGPLEPLVEELTAHAGYTLQRNEKLPVNPVQVAVSGQFKNPLLALNTVMASVARFASITVDNNRKEIILVYQ